MPPTPTTLALRIVAHRARVLLAALATALVAACGGGSGETPTPPLAGAPDATSFAAGPITGFGSVIVNGVRYDDSGAEILDEDGAPLGRERLNLGAMVEIDAVEVDHLLGIGRALRIRLGSEIVGPVDSVDVASGTLQVMGQPVVVNEATVIDERIPGGLAGLMPGDVIAVDAFFDGTTGVYTATRIAPREGVRFFKLRGLIADLDTAAKTFRIGGQVVNYALVPTAELRDWIANGMRVWVLVDTVQINGQWMAVRLRHSLLSADDRPDAHVKGTVTAFESPLAFEVNGLPVDASQARFPDGTNGLVLGATVEVHGSIVDGVLLATVVELWPRHVPPGFRLELHGPIGALDTQAKLFELRGVTVSYANVMKWEDGSEADLANGRWVEVKGRPSPDRTRLDAMSIEFE